MNLKGRHLPEEYSALKITDTRVITFSGSGYSFSKCIPMDSAVLYEPIFVYLQ